MKRNIGKHTPKSEVRANILAFLSRHARQARHCINAAAIGRAAYPGYNFKMNQGAAMSVIRVLREMEKEGLVAHHMDDFRKGFYITDEGAVAARQTSEGVKQPNDLSPNLLDSREKP